MFLNNVLTLFLVVMTVIIVFTDLNIPGIESALLLSYAIMAISLTPTLIRMTNMMEKLFTHVQNTVE